MRTAKTVLTVIQERGKQHKPIERVYKLLFNRDFYLNAYAKLRHYVELNITPFMARKRLCIPRSKL